MEFLGIPDVVINIVGMSGLLYCTVKYLLLPEIRKFREGERRDREI